jgi:mono/diheme cytochrome c family protein
MSNSEEPDIKQTPQKEVLDNGESVHQDFKDTDIDLKTVKKFVIGSFAVTLAIFVLMLVVHRMYNKAFTSERGVATAEERQIPGKEDALLQTQPLEERQAYFDGEEEKLTMTTNAVEHAVIPVESAKKLMMKEKAFPTPESAKETAKLSPMVAPPSEEGMSSDMSTASKEPAAAATPEPKAAPAESQAVASSSSTRMVPKYPNPPDPQLVSMGKKIWDVQCMAACHTGKKGAIGPNIHKAFGTMRQLENHDPILMDEEYVINSMNNPMEHIAKGYMPVMMSFKQSISDQDKKAVAAYLRSQGKEIMVPAPKSASAQPEAETESTTKASASTPAPKEPKEPKAEPAKTESTEPAAPAPAPKSAPEAPAAPVPTAEPPPGPIFV